jgi:hypothetical protein
MIRAVKNRYIGGLPPSPRRRVHNAWAWAYRILAVVLLLAIFTWAIGDRAHAARMPPLVVACLVFFVVSVLVQALRAGPIKEVAAAEALALREQFDDAVIALRAVLPRTTGYSRFRVLSALGSCALARGHFLEAAQVFGTAAAVGTGATRAMLAPTAHAHAAFALAAAGRFADADRALAWSATTGTGMPGTRAAVARARALLLAKRGDHDALRRHLDAEATSIRSALPRRDRVLLRVLAAGATPEAPGRVHVEPEIARFLALVVPEHRAVWEAP